MEKKVVIYVVDDKNKAKCINNICKNLQGMSFSIYIQNLMKTDCRNEKCFPELSVENNIIYYQKLYNDNLLPVEELLEKFGLSKISKFKVKKIGEKNIKKLSIAITFIGKPMCIILDNPFDNLGIETSSSIKDIMMEYVEENSAQIVIMANKLIEYEEMSDAVYCVKYNIIEQIK